MATLPNDGSGAQGSGTQAGGHSSQPRESFLQTPGSPVLPPVIVPIAPAPGRPTMPKPIRPKPEFLPSRERKQRLQKAAERLAKLAKHEAQRLDKKKLAKLAKLGKSANLIGAGFAIGWEIGDLLFPNGWYSFVDEPDPLPDQSVGPEGWTNLDWDWFPCQIICGAAGIYLAGVNISAPCIENGVPADCTNTGSLVWSTVYTSPEQALAAAHPTSNRILTHSPHPTLAGRMQKVGHFVKVSSSGAPWDQEYLPQPAKQAVPLAPARSSEAPETFPMEWPMEFPFAQPWETALPPPKTQGEGKHLPGTGTSVPPMPLVPFPVVVVTPPAVVPPVAPPTQVITIPPPAPPGSGQPPTRPPTIHTKPKARPSPPKGRTKEKKLSVRSKFNKAWVVINLATEAFDLIDALFQGLPDECKKKAQATIDYGAKGGGNADPYSKALAIYNCFDKMDWDKFVNAFINNQIEDMVFGMQGMAATHALKAGGGASGSGAVSARPGKLKEAASDKMLEERVASGEITEEQAKELDKLDDLPVPKMHFDPARGEWYVEIPGVLTIR